MVDHSQALTDDINELLRLRVERSTLQDCLSDIKNKIERLDLDIHSIESYVDQELHQLQRLQRDYATPLSPLAGGATVPPLSPIAGRLPSALTDSDPTYTYIKSPSLSPRSPRSFLF
jgi:hypothetical protein